MDALDLEPRLAPTVAVSEVDFPLNLAILRSGVDGLLEAPTCTTAMSSVAFLPFISARSMMLHDTFCVEFQFQVPRRLVMSVVFESAIYDWADDFHAEFVSLRFGREML